ncbi:MAG: DUF3383 domain-containing protein [Candidatus Binatia bacterium]
MSIPATQIVQINPGVLSGGGTAIQMNGVILTADTAVPLGTVQSFSSATAVSAFFGSSSTEAGLADIYFRGRKNATKLPGLLYFAQWNTSAASGYLRGGSLASMTLAQLQALTGTVIVTVGGVEKTSSTINLSGAASFSAAAALIEAGFTTPGFTVTYDSQRAAFKFTSTATGVNATMTVATGTLAAGLKLTTATGAVLSQGAAIATPSTVMNSVKSVTLNWATFMTTTEPDAATKVLFADWINAQNNRFAYAMWSTEAAAIATPDTTSSAAQIITAGYSGTVPIYVSSSLDATAKAAAFFLGATASLDLARTNGRITYAFKYLSGLVASVTDETIATNLKANGYNFIGTYATANDSFTFFYPGSVTGDYAFADEYINQIYLNAQLQLALIVLLTEVNSIPYNNDGKTLVRAACLDPILEFVNFGGIRKGVILSESQKAQVNNAAGVDIDTVLNTEGWYLQINDATAQVRAARGTFPMTLWYMDGGSVQQITMASIVIQ